MIKKKFHAKQNYNSPSPLDRNRSTVFNWWISGTSLNWLGGQITWHVVRPVLQFRTYFLPRRIIDFRPLCRVIKKIAVALPRKHINAGKRARWGRGIVVCTLPRVMHHPSPIEHNSGSRVNDSTRRVARFHYLMIDLVNRGPYFLQESLGIG